jgi:hypothetical protein
MQLQAKLHEPLQARGRANGPLDHVFEEFVNQTLDLWKVPGVAIASVDGTHVYHEVRSYISQSKEDRILPAHR